MGNAIFSRRWLGNSRRFRPQLESLERRLHLAADLDWVVADAVDTDAHPPETAASYLAEERVAPRTDLDSRARERSDSLANDSPLASPGFPAQEWAATLGTASPRHSQGAVPSPGQVLATRYSIRRTPESIDFFANEISSAELEELSPSSPALGFQELERPQAGSAMPLPAEDMEAKVKAEAADEEALACELQAALPFTVPSLPLASDSLVPSSRCMPKPAEPESRSLTAEVKPAMPLDSCAPSSSSSDSGSGSEAPKREPHERFACCLAHTLSNTNLQDHAWMDVLVGAPIGRLSVLNGFDVFHELQTETPTDETAPASAQLVDVLHFGVLTVGLSAAGLVMLRSNLSRKRIEAKDTVFGSSIHLDETLAPPL